jgi:acyl-CoA thioester hydrolase
MDLFKFYHPVVVRYGDLDPQGHLNNARYLTLFEQARIHYLLHLGLFKKNESFLDIGLILADAHLTFKRPVLFQDEVEIGVRISRLGNKSMKMDYRMINPRENAELATGATTLVAYDYHIQKTTPIPDAWREIITAFEGVPLR